MGLANGKNPIPLIVSLEGTVFGVGMLSYHLDYGALRRIEGELAHVQYEMIQMGFVIAPVMQPLIEV